MSAVAPSPAVLVVDDERGVREVVARWLTSGGYDVRTAENADQALQGVHRSAPAVALCDIRMPGHDGLWLVRQIRYSAPETAVVMATAVQDANSAITSLREGVVDYLTKPFGRDRLRESVSRAVEWHESARESRRWREALTGDVDARRLRLATAFESAPIDSDAALDDLLVRLFTSAGDAYAHAYRVAALAVGIGRALALDEADLAVIERAALLHDVGKLAMPEAVLRKPAPLTREEQDLVRRHPAIAAEAIRAFPYLAPAAELVRDVHERMDGLGYPSGVRAGDVALGARIIAVADAYDTMTRSRVFRDALAPGEALLEVERCAGAQFDPLIVEAFRRYVE
ncbi:MAG TPA: HD domain-containing phosphohydrolase [Vicinamibacterales bacterium]|jgi:response regulator RpfG family c-di-GMP phosphodiesterase